MEANTALPCRITDDDGAVIDTAVVTVFRAPKSFTGEDTVEISCHGGIIVSGDVLSRALECGAAPAGPGEFTRRAFSAGKLSLSQAEAIGEVISAKSRAALRLSRSNVDGRLAKGIDEIYTDIKTALSAVYAETDFPDEGLSPVSPDEMRRAIVNVKAKLEALKNSYKAGHAVVEGIQTVLCGKPNTGKSTLLNLLCEAERAIVTDIAGTTRDIITEQVTCGDATLLISDTAGIRDTDDKIEAVGVDRALEKLDGAEFIIAVFDASKPLDEDDIRVISAVKGQHASGAVTLAVLNKTDLGTAVSENELTDAFDETVIISAKDNSSREKIADVINALFIEGQHFQYTADPYLFPFFHVQCMSAGSFFLFCHKKRPLCSKDMRTEKKKDLSSGRCPEPCKPLKRLDLNFIRTNNFEKIVGSNEGQGESFPLRSVRRRLTGLKY